LPWLFDEIFTSRVRTHRGTIAVVRRVAFALTLGIAAAPRAAAAMDWPNADDSTRPCRPTVSCTADIAKPGALEIEAGALYAKTGEPRLGVFPFLLKQTLTELVQLQVGSSGWSVVVGPPSAHWLDNVFFGPKLHLLDQGDIAPSLALTAQLSVPTFRSEGYVRNDDAFFTAHASKDIGRLHVDWNVGVDLWRVDDSPMVQEFTALALSTALPPPFGVALEGYYFTDAAPLAPRDGGLRGALSATIRSWLVVDAGGDAGFFPSTRAYSLFFGMTIIPAVFWRTGERFPS
jgi:hypothetical protein